MSHLQPERLTLITKSDAQRLPLRRKAGVDQEVVTAGPDTGEAEYERLP